MTYIKYNLQSLLLFKSPEIGKFEGNKTMAKYTRKRNIFLEELRSFEKVCLGYTGFVVSGHLEIHVSDLGDDGQTT